MLLLCSRGYGIAVLFEPYHSAAYRIVFGCCLYAAWGVFSMLFGHCGAVAVSICLRSAFLSYISRYFYLATTISL